MAKLGDICTINMGQSPESSSYNTIGDGLPFFQGNADFGDVHPTIRTWCSNPIKIAQKDDILISVRAPIGALNIANQRCCIGRGLASLTNYAKKIYRDYLWFALFSKIDELNTKGTGSTFKAINKKILAETDIPLPSLKRQEQIVKQLSCLDTLLSRKKQQLSKLDQLVKSRFIEMFGDPIRNEKNWPLVSLGEVAEICIGPFGTLLHKEDYIYGGHALINPSHIFEGKIYPDKYFTISEEKFMELKAYHLQNGDIVLGRRGEMGRCAVVEYPGLICGTGSMIIRPYKKLNPYIIQNILSYSSYKKIIEDKAVGVTMLNLNAGIVSELKIPLLPIIMQDNFINFIHNIDKLKSSVKQSLEILETLKKSLMQEYFG